SSPRRSKASTTGSKATAAFGKSASIASKIICASCRRRRRSKTRKRQWRGRRSRVSGKNSFELTDDPPAMSGTRVLDAPRDLVFAVWTDPRHLAKWWGPDGFSTTTSAFDLRVGGVWRFVMHGPDGRDYENRVTFDEIVKPELLRYHHGGGGDVEPVQFRTAVTFEDLGGMTRVMLRGEFPS